MGILFKDANGNAIAQLLQMVATDEQVNAAITGYLDRNGIHLAEGVDLQKMSSAITKNENSINGLMESVGGFRYCWHFCILDAYSCSPHNARRYSDLPRTAKFRRRNRQNSVQMPHGCHHHSMHNFPVLRPMPQHNGSQYI